MPVTSRRDARKKEGVAHPRHPVLAALDDEIKARGIPYHKLSAMFGDGVKARIMAETEGNPTIWSVEQMANVLGFRLALERRPHDAQPDRSIADTFTRNPTVVESLKRLKKGRPEMQSMTDVKLLGWDVEPGADPVIKAMALHFAAREITPQKFFETAAPHRNAVSNWLRGRSRPPLPAVRDALRAAGLGLKIVPLHEADEFTMAEGMARGIRDPKAERRATVYGPKP